VSCKSWNLDFPDLRFYNYSVPRVNPESGCGSKVGYYHSVPNCGRGFRYALYYRYIYRADQCTYRPGSFDYPVVGSLPVGGTAAAVGRSPAGEWVEIEFPEAPRGTAWVYAANVTLAPSNALLPVVEPPPTPAPLVTDTLNPTFVAAFAIVPTLTRLPTFTPPPPLAIPTYESDVPASSSRVITAWLMVGLGLIGILGIAFTSFRHR